MTGGFWLTTQGNLKLGKFAMLSLSSESDLALCLFWWQQQSLSRSRALPSGYHVVLPQSCIFEPLTENLEPPNQDDMRKDLKKKAQVLGATSNFGLKSDFPADSTVRTDHPDPLWLCSYEHGHHFGMHFLPLSLWPSGSHLGDVWIPFHRSQFIISGLLSVILGRQSNNHLPCPVMDGETTRTTSPVCPTISLCFIHAFMHHAKCFASASISCRLGVL
nr:uncharacterized protein LOC105491581 isoform X3 [Macaca nemestrina]